ncbi:MAG TPA: efflux RND transporter periplasmic adaptor subunit [Gammaproteobacteria bacterium]|jgi:membrane fusion protein (multidrug efflux system)|nr:efflux RND transporter periplasmic adaptor subunit [Gammaproteobacteria bacterium]
MVDQPQPQPEPSSTPIRRFSRRHRWLALLSMIFLCLGLLYLLYWIFIARFYETTDDAYVDGNTVQVMSQINGHVTAILAEETDLVVKGEPIIQLEKADAEIALKNAEAQLALTARQVAALYKDVAEWQANVQTQQDNLDKTQADFTRRQQLVVNRTISIEDLQHAKIAFQSAQSSLLSAQNQLAANQALVGHIDLYHHPKIQEAAAKLRDAYLTWQRTTIYAPETGYIAKRSIQVGEHVTPNMVLMVIVPLNQVWVEANFKESQLQHIRIGQTVDIIADAYGSGLVYHGKVIGLSPGTGSAFDLLPPQNATGNWIKIVQRLPVRIGLDAAQLKKYPLRIGLSVTATVYTRQRQGAVLAQAPKQNIIYQTKDYSVDLQHANQLIDLILRANAPNLVSE